MATRDYYCLLGVSPTAAENDIRKAYWRLAKTKHPDTDQTPDATARFQEINEAYEVLSDQGKRDKYDCERPPAPSKTASRSPDGGSSARSGATVGRGAYSSSERGSKRTPNSSGRSQERQAQARREREAREREEERAQARREREAKERAERAAQARREREDKEAQARREQEAKERAETAAQARREREDKEAQARREQEAKERAEREAQARRERETREQWEREIREFQERQSAMQDVIIGPNAYTLQNARRRDNPYIWVSWLSKLLAGSNSCEWASWFKTQYDGSSWEKVESEFSLEQWKVDHTAMCLREANRLEDTGATVRIENGNSFNLALGNITLGGKPDLVASFPDGTLMVQDCKTGKAREEHIAQIMLCMWALPLAFPEYRGKTLQGKVVYRSSEMPVPAHGIDDRFVLRAKSLIDRLADDSGARRAPSRSECRFCEIPRPHCNDRIG